MQPDVVSETKPRSSLARPLLLIGTAAVAIVGIGWLARPDTPAVALPDPLPVAQVYAGHDATKTLADIDAKIAGLEARIATPNGDMIDHENLSIAYVARSKLTGDFADLFAAQTALDGGFAKVPAGMGPWLAKAAAAYSAHRLDDAATALDKVDGFVAPDTYTRAEAKAIRADVSMARGNDAEAARLLDEAAKIDRWPGLYFRQALLARLKGDFDGARTAFAQADAANRNPTPLFRADMHLRQGELDFAQGRWDDARAHYADAAKTLPGYIRADMRVAQMMALDGKVPEALSRFEAIATEINAPEAMDILAGLYRAQGDAAASNRWAARAGAIWQSRLKLLPEAAWAHAAEHELAFGSPRKALRFAGKNARIRPDDSGLLLLAKAWIANGRADYALALCGKIERSGWVSAEQWLVRADALSLLGRGDDMRAAQDQAKALNPRALERNPAFAWLDH